MTVVVTQNNITSPNADVTALTVGTANGLNFPNAGPLSNRNLIINGAMQVAQRGTATGITGDNFGGPDRYKCFMGNAGTWTLSQAADAPTGTGLYYSYKFQCTSAGTLSSGSYLGHRMILEGYDSVPLNGKSFTISFWVKCNKTGTMTCEPYDASSGGTQSVSKQFTINAANTWEYKSITFPANPRDYASNNAGAIVLHWWMSAGSTWKSVASTGGWTNFNNGFRAYGCNIDLIDSTNNYFQITGIQLEVGSVATPFEHRSFGDELARCQRYFQQLSSCELVGSKNTSTRMRINGKLLVQMRTPPTVTRTSTTLAFQGAGVSLTSTDTTAAQATTQGVRYMAFDIGGFTSLADRSYGGADSSGNSPVFNCDAEL